MSTPQPIIVTGFMGSGKTTVALALSRLLQCGLIDLDRFITEQTGRSPGEIIEQDGERAFREIETRYLTEVLTNGVATVIALGGGAWTTPENRTLIEKHDGQVVWLDTPFEVCWQRIAALGSERPLARDREETLNLYQSRRPIYQLAALRLDTSGAGSDEETAFQIADALRPAGKPAI
jgi:shikimate kinase